MYKIGEIEHQSAPMFVKTRWWGCDSG